jgi:hypothetical protein
MAQVTCPKRGDFACGPTYGDPFRRCQGFGQDQIVDVGY